MLLAAFTAACTQTNTEEEYEMEIQIIDKNKLEPPGKRGQGSEESREEGEN